MKTRRVVLLWTVFLTILGFASWWLACGPVSAQSPAGDLVTLINAARLNQGLAPYAVSAELAAAAQRHSDDMAATGQISHTGSDGSSSTQRILEAGYGVYEFGPVVSENIFGGAGGASIPFNSWMEQSGARSNLLSEKYREVGIGVSNDNQGRTFWTLNVGAQPNVLPMFINDGAASVDTVTVTLRLVAENVVPDGRGTAMGQPLEYRASADPQFVDAEWESWVDTATFVLDDTFGRQAVYVQLRDSAGRTTVSQASVTLVDSDVTGTPSGADVTATPETLTATPSLTAAATRTPRASPTATNTAKPPDTPTGTPNPTPTPSVTPQPSATAVPSPSATSTPVPPDTPTDVPTPSETITSPPLPTRVLEVTFAQTTPDQRTIIGAESDDTAEPLSLAARLAPWALGLQIIALMLGVYVALRRPSD